MQDEQATELLGFDSRGVLVGRASMDWMTGNWTVRAGRALTCNVWLQSEAEAILRRHGAVDVRESHGKK